MSAVMIRCPITREPVSTAVEVDPTVFRRLPKVAARNFCPACGQKHVWATGSVWLADESRLSDGQRPTAVA